MKPLSFLKTLLLLICAPLAAYAEKHLVMWANHKGNEGFVRVGTNTVAEVRSYEYSLTNEPIDDTIMSDTARTFVSGVNSWSGNLSCFWDETDTNGQEALVAGGTATMTFYPEGTTTATTDVSHTGVAIIEEVTRRAALQGIVEVDFRFRGTGALTQNAN
jgi:hypothetical protein